METVLSRIDYCQVEATNKSCLTLLTSGKSDKGRDQVVVGSHNGVLSCIWRKNKDTHVIFETSPGPARIECVQLGGALGSIQDKIFIAMGGTIKGFSKKGKLFFTFETNMTEPVSCMFIYGVDMLLCGRNTFNHYHDGADAHYLCSDKINDILCLPIVEGPWVGRGLTPVLACSDKTIKVLSGSDLAYELVLGGIPNILHLYLNDGGVRSELVLYGTVDGKIGLTNLPTKSGTLLWEVTSKSDSAVTAMHCYSLLSANGADLIAGRDDGLIEIYSIDVQNRISLAQSYQCDESVTGLQCGRVNCPDLDEIVVSTYTGWVFGLTCEQIRKQLGPDDRFNLDPQTELKVQQLKQELESLQSRVTGEREEYHKMTLNEEAAGVSAIPLFAINDRFLLNRDEAVYLLSIELIVPIDYVLFQSGNALLATYRCQAKTTRFELKIRSIEGQYGTLRAYVAPKMNPKMCQMRQYSIKPLSLHQRTHNYDASRPRNELRGLFHNFTFKLKMRIRGQFSMAEAHSWVNFCLPEMPEKVPPGEQAQFYFSSTFIGTQLRCIYSKGQATFDSDNLSVIAILSDVLGKEATKRKLKVDINCDINDESAVHTLQLLHPHLEYQLNLAKKVHLAEALKEMQISHTEGMPFLSEEFVEIMSKSEELTAEYERQTAHLERIYGMVTDLYIDKFKFSGVSVKHRIPELLQILDNYSFDSLVAFFHGQTAQV